VDGGFSDGDAATLIARVEGLSAVWHRPDSAPANKLLAGAGAVAEDWQDEELALSGTMFLQVNRAAAALLEDHVLGLAGDVAGKRVVDAYCGIGLHARRFARAGARVIGIEMDTEAVEEARRTAPRGVEIRQGSVEELLPRALPADLVVLNPPRAGLDAAVPDALLACRPARLIYVSCNPATLARDVQRLSSAYNVVGGRCFDLFPQTAHVETVLELACATS
jgi:23S rRNA (uracil1939-C5)-methyltransferase